MGFGLAVGYNVSVVEGGDVGVVDDELDGADVSTDGSAGVLHVGSLVDSEGAFVGGKVATGSTLLT